MSPVRGLQRLNADRAAALPAPRGSPWRKMPGPSYDGLTMLRIHHMLGHAWRASRSVAMRAWHEDPITLIAAYLVLAAAAEVLGQSAFGLQDLRSRPDPGPGISLLESLARRPDLPRHIDLHIHRRSVEVGRTWWPVVAHPASCRVRSRPGRATPVAEPGGLCAHAPGHCCGLVAHEADPRLVGAYGRSARWRCRCRPGAGCAAPVVSSRQRMHDRSRGRHAAALRWRGPRFPGPRCGNCPRLSHSEPAGLRRGLRPVDSGGHDCQLPSLARVPSSACSNLGASGRCRPNRSQYRGMTAALRRKHPAEKIAAPCSFG